MVCALPSLLKSSTDGKINTKNLTPLVSIDHKNSPIRRSSPSSNKQTRPSCLHMGPEVTLLPALRIPAHLSPYLIDSLVPPPTIHFAYVFISSFKSMLSPAFCRYIQRLALFPLVPTCPPFSTEITSPELVAHTYNHIFPPPPIPQHLHPLRIFFHFIFGCGYL